MKQDFEKLTYLIYARKSSEREDRQVQSIDDQVARLTQLAKSMGLKVAAVLTEAKSAKEPGIRPIYAEMIQRLRDGEASGILCWQINRLSRNPVDSGEISWLLQQGIIKSIQTIDRQYLPDDNVLLLSVETGSANQYILDLSKNTKRGLLNKLNQGWQNGVAPVGYLNDRENKTIIKDPERFGLIRKAWDLMLTGSYTPPQILEILNNDWGFRTRKTKRMGGNPLSRSAIYKIFTSQFYAGVITVSGIEYEGGHEKMVTLQEFDRVQLLLGRKGKPRPKKHKFSFTGAIRCGVCGCLYTAQTKTKLIKSTGEIREYTYYHCTRKSKKRPCNQKQYIPERKLEKMIEGEIEKYTILPEFLHWALEALSTKNNQEIEDRTKIYEMRHKNLVKTQSELDELTRMRYKQLIDDDTFLKEKDTLQKIIREMKELLRETENRAEEWLELTEQTFHFATYARSAFINAEGENGLELKKQILLALGKTPIITGNKLYIEPNDWLVPIKNDYHELEAEYLRLEPDEITAATAKSEALDSIRARWLGGMDSNHD